MKGVPIMKKKALLFCLLAGLLLLCLFGRNNLLKKTGHNVHIYRWDGEKTTDYWAFDDKNGKPVVKALKKVRARKAPDWTADLAEMPLYGISVDTFNGRDRKALWTGGYWIDEEGNAWTFDFDFEQMIADTQWADTWERDFIAVPCYRYAAQNGDNWNPVFLNPADQIKVQAGLTMTIKTQEKDTITAEIRNDGSAAWEYGAGWGVQVCLDGAWYGVPSVNSFDIPAIAFVLEPGDVREITYNLTHYGDLPPGLYRIVQDGLTAEFTLE